MRYAIYVQPQGGGYHPVDTPYVTEAKAFAKWLSSATGAGVGIYDLRTDRLHSRFADFDEETI